MPLNAEPQDVAVIQQVQPTHCLCDGSGSVQCFILSSAVCFILVVAFRCQAAEIEKTTSASAPIGVVTFEADVQPLLTRFGCNSGPCHGKSRGQNGFALSLLGFDSDFDYSAIAINSRGRRLNPSAPEASLLLRKATGQDAHVGGSRFGMDSPYYALIRQWIADGAPRTPGDAPRLERVRMSPERLSLSPGQAAPLKVLADYSDGAVRDVTDAAAFDSNDRNVANVSSTGQVQAGELPGETAIMSRYMNHISVCNVTIPLPGKLSPEDYAALPRRNLIDEAVIQKLQLLGLWPSPAASQSTLLRRSYLRLIGRLPTAQEARAYLEDVSPDRREKLVDHLLEQPEYADFWANKWADLLRPNPYRVGMKAVYTLDSWLRQVHRENLPYHQFVTQLVTAQGSTWRDGPAVVYRDRPDTVEIASSMSQLFLGIRLECAKCHHHPFEVWSQEDFYGFAAFFSRIGRKGSGLSPPISGEEEMIFNAPSGNLVHERTGQVAQPKTLTGESLQLGPDSDPRQVLAAWMTSDENPYFPRVMANRVWAELMGLGIVEPVDDIRATNPASNQALLDYLAQDFRLHGYDIKHLIRRIALSETFARSSQPGEGNSTDNRNFSRYYRQRIRAETLLDSINAVLGAAEKLDAMPPGSRAMQIWTHRVPSTFLDTFGRPDANLDPPLDRFDDLTTPQMLHLMNSQEIENKLSADEGRLVKLASSPSSNEQLIEELYLSLYARLPTEIELGRAVATFPPDPQQSRLDALQNLTWALINTPEFYFVD